HTGPQELAAARRHGAGRQPAVARPVHGRRLPPGLRCPAPDSPVAMATWPGSVLPFGGAFEHRAQDPEPAAEDPGPAARRDPGLIFWLAVLVCLWFPFQ